MMKNAYFFKLVFELSYFRISASCDLYDQSQDHFCLVEACLSEVLNYNTEQT
jgi:hypothetical protein